MDCLFCRIANKEIDSEIVLETENVMVFKDINPQAPVHLLAIPKQHVDSIMEAGNLPLEVLGEIMEVIAKVAKDYNLEKDGFRVVTNTGRGAGQSVDHLHFHILGKRQFSWPPG
ncbi:MAG: histidine triad nucleotide-binding protein [Actinomycetota bacterium]|nr:histidine triad nucleotide-binding protein [Actinomycetota bacterium]